MGRKEIRTLTWGQIDFAGRSVKVGKSKNEFRTGRVIPLNLAAFEALVKWAPDVTRGPRRRSPSPPESVSLADRVYGQGRPWGRPNAPNRLHPNNRNRKAGYLNNGVNLICSNRRPHESARQAGVQGHRGGHATRCSCSRTLDWVLNFRGFTVMNARRSECVSASGSQSV
jgi:integrase